MSEKKNAGHQLVEYMERLGVREVFGLCGHTVIPMLDAISKSKNMRFITARHEQLAAHMADGFSRASGKPAVLMLHVAPGMTNAVTGVMEASLCNTPMVVFAGDVPSTQFGRHAHQEMLMHRDADQYEIYQPFCKRIFRVDRVEDLPRIAERAFHIAQSGRPGAVFVDLPMDILCSDLPVGAFDKVPSPIARPAIETPVAEKIAEMLAQAKNPVIYAGGGIISGRASEELAALSELLEIPIAHTVAGKGCVSDAHPLMVGMTGMWGTPAAHEMCRTSDIMLAVGTRLGDLNANSWDPKYSHAIPPTKLIHIDIDVMEIGRNYQTELGVVANVKQALGAILAAAKTLPKPSRPGLRKKIAEGREAFRANWASQTNSDQYPMRPERILAELRKVLPNDGYLVTDVGWNKNGAAQQFPIYTPGTFMGPTAMTTMGFGPACALGVKYAKPDRAVVGLIGDGAFGSNPSVIATAVELSVPVVWVIMDNAGFGVIANLEEKFYNHAYGCFFESKGKPYRQDYAGAARIWGANGVMIGAAGELGPAIQKALASDLPTVIQVPMENAPTPTPGFWKVVDLYKNMSK
jgi:acetolactate synthase I/II/III large subunit